MSSIRPIPFPRHDPVMGHPPRSRFLRALWRLRHDLRTALGLRRSFRAEGVYFKETTTVPLWRSLSRGGSKGVKEYRVTYPDGSKQYIQCTAERVYADAMGPLLLPSFHVARGMIRPGSRVLCMPGGTGYAPSWLGKHVGRSGGVVSIESDKESVLFAQKRYGAPNVAFEQGGIAALRGEIDGAFDAVLSITHHVVDPGADVEVLREMWRVTRPGGWMLVGRGGGGVSPAEVLERVRGIAVVPASPDERGEEGASEQSNGGSRPGGRTGGRGERRGEGHGEGRGADRGADRGGAREPGRGQSETGEGTPLSAPVEVISETSDPVCLAIARKPEV